MPARCCTWVITFSETYPDLLKQRETIHVTKGTSSLCLHSFPKVKKVEGKKKCTYDKVLKYKDINSDGNEMGPTIKL